MQLRRKISLCCGLLPFVFAVFAGSIASPQDLGDRPAQLELGKGVVTDAVKKYSEAEKAGLQTGDILLSWSRGETKGDIESPFDLSEIEVEQAPRGPVTFEGLRGTEKRIWVLGPSSWGLHVQANLPVSLYVEGKKLTAAGKTQEATEYWRSAAQPMRDSQPSWLAPWFLFHAAELLTKARQWKAADPLFQEAIERSAEESSAKVELLRAWAITFRQRGASENAEKYYRAAANAIPTTRAESLLFASLLDEIGFSLWQRGDSVEAEKQYSRALEIQQKLAPGSLAVTYTLGYLVNSTWTNGDLARSERYVIESLKIQEKLAPGSLAVATSLERLGLLAMARSDLSAANQLYLQALAIQEKLTPGGLELVVTLNNLGIAAERRGDLTTARKYDEQALAIEDKLLEPGDPGIARTLTKLSTIAAEQGDIAAADGYLRRVLAIGEQSTPNEDWLAATLVELANLYQKRGDLAKAEDYTQRSLILAEKRAPGGLVVAAELSKLGDLARDDGNFAKAEEHYRRSLPIWEAVAPEKADFAETLAHLGGVLLRQGQLAIAAPLFERALSVLEGQINHLGGSEDIRAGFRAGHVSFYRDYVDLLMGQKQPEKALDVVERSRAQSLLEMLAAAHIDVRKGVDAALLERERSLAMDITAKTNRRIRLMGEEHAQERVAAVNQEIERLLAEHKDVEEQIRVTSPGYAALAQPRPLGAKQIQELLDADTLLLEYSVGEERSYLWAVTPESLTAYELPKQKDIEDVARKVYQLLIAQNQIIDHETKRQAQARLAQAEKEYPQAAEALSRLILGPAAAQLKGKKRLVIVSDGALQNVPFAALPEPGDGKTGNSANRPPLMVEHEIVNLPSASVLAVLRQDRIGRAEAAKTVAVLADPVFDDKDTRLKQPGTRGQRESRNTTRGSEEQEHDAYSFELRRSATDLGLSVNGRVVLSRLPWTRREAEDILAVTPRGQGRKLLDFSANHAAATDPALGQYRIVHFATHGLLDDKNPELSGLVLSLFDKRGQPRDGFLGLREVYNLKLPVDLVVLSGCQTGLGKEMQGEGLIGLTRGFMYAGASRVVASLWSVSDPATAELMAHFYKGMEQEGMPPAAALRSAQIKMWKQKIWRSPYFWAAFQIQGEWR
jgi:CHAT domain-containing protein/Tfp pilus assembly protein PilF